MVFLLKKRVLLKNELIKIFGTFRVFEYSKKRKPGNARNQQTAL